MTPSAASPSGTPSGTSNSGASRTGLAIVIALAMIGYQVAAKATRDALFLSSFPVSSLPAMTVAAAVVAVAMAFAASRLLTRYGPERVIPMGFAGSAALLLAEWMALPAWPKPTVVFIYLHYSGLGGLLVSAFWAFLSERFDPRSAKRKLGRVTAAGTIGGLLGGLVADRVGSSMTVATMLPILAVLHAVCAVLVTRFRPALAHPGPTPGSTSTAEAGASDVAEAAAPPAGPGMRGAASESWIVVLRRSRYLRTFVILMILVTMSEGLVDWIFKARAASAMVQGESLLRLFGAFYTGVSLLTVLVQAIFARFALERLGLARSVATLPAAVGVGSAGALLWPGLGSAMGLRATESVLSNSIYRSAYEVLFNPVPPAEKRAVKTIVDVGAARAGDFVGAALIQGTLFMAGISVAQTTLLIAVMAITATTLIVAYRLHAGYVRALERGLVSRAVHLDLSDVGDVTTRTTMLQTFKSLELSQALVRPTTADGSGTGAGAAGAASHEKDARGPEDSGASGPVPVPPRLDAESRRAAAIHSGRAAEVRAALREGPVPPDLQPKVVSLLAWDEVAREAIAALRNVGTDCVPLLAEAIADPDSDFAIRRRVPLILGTFPDASAVEALLVGLGDKRFEVRYRCGRALHHLLTTFPRLGVPPERVFEAVMREVNTERKVWEGQRLLDQLDDESWAPAFDEALRARANRSLEHVFTLLALALPRKPLQIAYRGLFMDDELLRGTALEYLETTLPDDVRKPLWPYLEDTRPKKPHGRSADSVLADLLQSNQSIALRLDEIRRLETPDSPPRPPRKPSEPPKP